MVGVGLMGCGLCFGAGWGVLRCPVGVCCDGELDVLRCMPGCLGLDAGMVVSCRGLVRLRLV